MDDQPLAADETNPTPESSARPAVRGTDLTLADGRAWTLADFVPRPDVVWDRLFDSNLLAKQYRPRDVRIAGVRLLLANHELPLEFAMWLILGADVDKLARAVEFALFGRQDEPVGWSDWVAGSFWSNGIDPESIPPPVRRLALDSLVAAGRAVPLVDFTSAGKAAAKRAELAAKFELAASLKGQAPGEP